MFSFQPPDLGASTKYQIALSLARAFSQIAWRLPPPRKAWKRHGNEIARLGDDFASI